jgi:hypothetical protein
MKYWDQALKLDPEETCWFHREVCLHYWYLLDLRYDTYNADSEVASTMKYGWCKKLPKSQALTLHVLTEEGGPPYEPLCVPTSIADVSKTLSGVVKLKNLVSVPAEQLYLTLLTDTAPFSNWVHLNCRGFLPNKRQKTMFQLAVQHMAQSLREHVESVKNSGPGLQINNCSNSLSFSRDYVSAASLKQQKNGADSETCRVSSGGGSSSSSSSGGSKGLTCKRVVEAQHEFNWRDFFDIAVRWRQASELGDPVWWIDRLPDTAFEEGFGLQVNFTFIHFDS